MTDAPRQLGEVLRAVRERLAQAGIADAALESRILVEGFTGATRTDILLDPNRPVGPLGPLWEAVERRTKGEPVHRILGYREFYGLRLSLSAETLEPRPDTETLVDAVLPFARSVAEATGACRILDLGTGTGAIVLALLAECPKAIGTGTDVSDDALATATKNADELRLSARFEAKKSDWFAEIDGLYDVIVSNPPYIPSQDIQGLQREVRDFDPLRALDGGKDGLAPYRIIAAEAAAFLTKGGRIAVEIGYDQKDNVSALFEASRFRRIDAVEDLGGNDRVLVFTRP